MDHLDRPVHDGVGRLVRLGSGYRCPRSCLRGEKRPSTQTLILWAQAVTSDQEAYRQDKVGYPSTLSRLMAAVLADAAADLS